MNFPSKKVIPRYGLVAVVLGLVCVVILGKIVNIMFVQKTFWMAVSERFVKENVEVQPVRGNIFSADGQLMASSLPEYKLYIDFISGERDSARYAKDQARRDSLLDVKMDSICDGLHRLFPDKSANEFRRNLQKGREKNSRHWLIYPYRVSYIKYKAVRRLPLFRLSQNKGGFHALAFNQRKNPFGSLASRTLGDLYAGKDSARCGLELAFDSILRGKPGITRRQKVMNRYLNIGGIPPQDGCDLETTIDVEMQDIAENALVEAISKLEARVGVAIVMEVATGDVKAIVNMTRCADGKYREIRNDAVSNLLEPGSVFKPVSFMVAFNDGYIHMNDNVDTGFGTWDMYGRTMYDHNWRRGGYGMLTVPECLEYSSNVGVSRLIDKYYHDNPQKFVEGIYKTGIHDDLHIPIPGYARPRIRMPKKDGSNWSKTALPWMSIGYETQVPPISTLAFYNGVANNGRMMRPRFVKSIKKDGEIIETFDPVVVREQMCSKDALQNLQTCLEWVVSKGLGKKAGSPNFRVSGKTGTAQLWTASGFSSRYLISFVGYFPSEKPLYSCIVCMQKGIPASGGGMCGPVFRQIAENIMARHLQPSFSEQRDTVGMPLPYVKCGNVKAAKSVLQTLGIPYRWLGTESGQWGEVVTDRKEITLKQNKTAKIHGIPDVRGMGVRDAVYRLESMGLRVRLHGQGKVVKMSPEAGSLYNTGQTVHLTLSINAKTDEESIPEMKEMPLQETLKDTSGRLISKHDTNALPKKREPAVKKEENSQPVKKQTTQKKDKQGNH